ncbi:MAG: single-stranded DNA-binding protein [Acidimicrobiales bacterium]|jgi:single-strand DNA-binding protein|nr:single-stranded DNA-binding protein [Acidimicrobiales bacterium]
MADANVTVVGNITRDPELRFTNSGMQVTTFGLAVNNRRQNRQSGEWEEETSFLDVTSFGQMAENVAESVGKGTRVVVTGRLRVRTYDRRDGGQGTAVEVIADEIAPSLRWATAQVTKASRTGGFEGGGGGGGRPAGGSSGGSYTDDEEPF